MIRLTRPTPAEGVAKSMLRNVRATHMRARTVRARYLRIACAQFSACVLHSRSRGSSLPVISSCNVCGLAMGRFIRIVGPHHREPQQQHVGPEAREKAWREALDIRSVGQNASRIAIALQHRRMGDECVIEFCDWLRKQTGLLTRRGIEVHIDTFDLSNNDVGNDGLARVAATLRDIAPRSLRVLKLHHNRIENATPLLDTIAKGQLGELHLSHNQLSSKSIFEIVIAAASAKDAEGDHRYPRSGTSPLWLRVEGNPQNAVESEKLAVDITEHLSLIGRPLWRSICVVDGSTQCVPSRCCAKLSAPPAMHLTYMDFNQEKRLDPKRGARTPQAKRRESYGRCASGRAAVRAIPEALRETCASPPFDIFSRDTFPPLERSAGEASLRGKMNRWPNKMQEKEPQEHTTLVTEATSCVDASYAPSIISTHEATCKIATADYAAEAQGYLSATFGDPIYVWSDEAPADLGCRYSSYIFAQNGRTHEFGWFPCYI